MTLREVCWTSYCRNRHAYEAGRHDGPYIRAWLEHYSAEIGRALLFGVVVTLALALLWWIVRLARGARPCAVYHLPDLNGDLLYVGHAYDPDARLARHKRDQLLMLPDNPRKWWPRLSWSIQETMHVPDDCITWYVNLAAACAVEVRDIRKLDPPGNVLKYKGVSVTDD